jgi:hypothetical protein
MIRLRALATLAMALATVPAVAQDTPTPAPKPAAAKPAAPAPASTAAPTTAAPKPAPKPAAAASAAKGVTPNAERIVTIAAMDKRTGETRDFVGNPGQMFGFGALTVRVRTCETTPPWEQKLTGAFLLIDEAIGKAAPKRVYSGWMFAESPSLHPLEHARYDVWVKSCTMRFPETGPATVVAGSVGGGAKPASAKASSAKKSPATPSAEAN